MQTVQNKRFQISEREISLPYEALVLKMPSSGRRGCYPPRRKAKVDNTLLDRQNSPYPTQPHSIIANYFIVALGPLECTWSQQRILLLTCCLVFFRKKQSEVRSFNAPLSAIVAQTAQVTDSPEIHQRCHHAF